MANVKNPEEGDVHYEADKPLNDGVRNHLKLNLDYLTKNVDAEQVLMPLTQIGALSLQQKDEIKAESTPARQAAVLLNIILRGSGAQFAGLLKTLYASNQFEVVDILNDRTPRARGAIEKVQPKRLVKLNLHQDILIRNMRFEGSLLVHLCSAEVITDTQMYDLQALPNRLKRAEALFAYVTRGANNDRIEKFAKVLTLTGQAHLSALLLEEGNPDVITKENRRALRPNMAKYVEGLKETGAIDTIRDLAEAGVVTEAQMEDIEHRATPRERAELLLDILMCRPLTALQALPKCIGPGIYGGLSEQSGPISLPLPEPPGLDDEGDEHESHDEIRVKMLQGPGEIDDSEGLQWKSTVKPGDRFNKGKPHFGNYGKRLRQFQKVESRHSNRMIQHEFGLAVGKAVFFITLLLVPRNVPVHGQEKIRQGFEHQHELYVDMPSLFSLERKGQQSQRILVIGAAGSGKSTLIQYATEQWASGAIWSQFHYVFNLTCRRLNSLVEKNIEISLLDLILRHGPKIDRSDEAEVQKEILSNLHHTLIVVDGVDELSGWTEFTPGKSLLTRDIQEPARILDHVYSLMVGDLIAESCVLFTSRPIDNIDLGLFKKTVRIFGFGRESVEKCILALANGEEDAQKAALEYLDHRPHLYLFCTLPLGCIMTGRVVLDELSRDLKENQQHETINCATVLYIYVLLVFLNRRGQLTQNIKDRFEGVYVWCTSLLKMMKLAAWGMLRSSPQIIFSTQTIREHAIDENDLPCGLLDITTEDTQLSIGHSSVSAAFIHYSLQEFLTALYIAITWKTADIKLITNRGASHTFNMVLLFLSGLLGNPLGKQLIQAINNKITSKTLDKRLIKLFDSLVVAYEGRFRFLPTVSQTGKDKSKLGRLQLLRCAAESNHSGLVQRIDRLVLKAGVLDLTDMPGGLLPEHLPAVAFFIHCSKTVKALRLEARYCCRLVKMKTPESERRLVTMIDTSLLESGHLDLHGLQLSEEEAAGLCTYVMDTKSLHEVEKYTAIQLMRGITSENKASLQPILDTALLQSGGLDLRGSELNIEDIARIVTYVLSSNLIQAIEKCTALQLMRGITAENQARLVPLLDTAALQSGVLDLKDTNLSESDIVGIVTYILSTQPLRSVEKYTAVKMMRGIIAKNQARLVPVLDSCALESWEDAGIQRDGKLDMSFRSLREDDLSALAHYLALSRGVTNLRLWNCEVTDIGAAQLASVLETNVNTRIEILNLPFNKISDRGAESLAAALRSNSSLKSLYLDGNPISDVGAESLATALRVNTSLKTLELWAGKLSYGKPRLLREEFGGRVQFK